ncbi:BhlA/UviB family holin-like peptide [Aminipila sp.]|uniref:BhlA/UviB family holin-like peptide n=1 Tax=Aminipila sp. TaxID=2060095 RepID=UPI0028A2903E|nr:BhlA/UviB family holin-like peptide [Aminipila sp.]
MENEIIEAALSQGIWAVLSVVLLFYIIRTQEKRDEKQNDREQKYQELLGQLAEKLNIVQEIKTDIAEIKKAIKKI